MTTGFEDDGEPIAAAAGNWLWLTGLAHAGDALCVGSTTLGLRRAIAGQFDRVTEVDRTPNAPATLASIPAASFDYIVLAGALEWWPAGPADLFGSARRLLRPGGWLCVPMQNHLYSAPHRLGLLRRIGSALSGVLAVTRGAPLAGRLATTLRQAGFGDVSIYGLEPSWERPNVVVPHRREAALAYERHRRQQFGGSDLRVILAALGMHDVLYAGWLFLATA